MHCFGISSRQTGEGEFLFFEGPFQKIIKAKALLLLLFIILLSDDEHGLYFLWGSAGFFGSLFDTENHFYDDGLHIEEYLVGS